MESSTVKFLNERIKQIEEKLAQTEEGKELQVLRKVVNELTQQPLNLAWKGKGIVDSSAEIKRERSNGGTRDMSNSPVAHLPFGQRTLFVYNLIEEIVINNSGTVKISVLIDYLKEIHNLSFKNAKNPSDSLKFRVMSYIHNYNMHHPEDKRLELLKDEVGNYCAVAYVGKQRIAV